MTPGTPLLDRLKVLAGNLRRTAKHPHDAEAIHKLRVAIRRFTQALRVFHESLDSTQVRKMRKRLHRIMEPCGIVRNCDIALDVLEAAGVPAGKLVKHRLRHARSRAGRDLVKRLHDDPVNLRRWKSYLKPQADPASPDDLLQNLARDFSKLGTAAVRTGASYAKMHEFRLLVKRYRYTLEILGGPKGRLEELERMQERLGAINDCVATADLLVESSVEGVELRRIKTALHRLLASRTAEFRVYWKTHNGRTHKA